MQKKFLFLLLTLFLIPVPSILAETGIVMYNEGTSSDLYWRDFTDSTISGSENSLSISSSEYWVDCESVSADADRILCGGGSFGSGDLLMWEYDATANTMTAKTTVTSDLPATATASFDIACEYTTGDCLVVYIEATSDHIGYRTWDLASSDWSGESTLTTVDDDNGYWIRLAPDPSSDDIMMCMEEPLADGATLTCRVWDGSSWGSATDHGGTSLAIAIKLTQDFDMAWEGDLGTAHLIWFDDEDATAADMVTRTWTSAGGWTTETIIIDEADTSTKQGNVLMATEFAGAHDDVGLCLVEGNAKVLDCRVYTSSWSSGTTFDASETGKGGRGNQNLAWEYGSDGDLYVAIMAKSSGLRMVTYDQSGTSWGSVFSIDGTDLQKGTTNIEGNPNSDAMVYSFEDGKNQDWQGVTVCDDIGTACTVAGGWATFTQLRSDAVTSVNNVHDVAFLDGTVSVGGDPTYVVDLMDIYESESTTLGSGNVVCLDVDLEIASECFGHMIVGHTYRIEIEVDETAGNSGSPTTLDIDSSVGDYDVAGNVVVGQILDSGCSTNTNWAESIVSTDIRATSGTTCALSSSSAEFWIIVRINSDAGSGAQPTATFTISDGSISDTSTTTTFTVDNSG